MLCKGKENSWRVKGNVGSDARVNTISNGKTVVSFSVATMQGFKDEDTLWTRFVFFGDTSTKYGSTMVDILSAVRSGDYVDGLGYVRVNEYDRKDGTKAFEPELVIDQFQMLVRKADKPDKNVPF